MLRRIGACCLMFSLTGFTASRLDTPAAGLHAAIPDLPRRLLLLQERASRHPDHRLRREEVAEILPELVHFDSDGHPRAVRHRLLSSLLLEELRRLSERVAALEAGHRPAPGELRARPLVRIRVVRYE